MNLDKFEKDNIEYKEAKNKLPKSIYKTVSSFANTKGGIIVLGIKQQNDKLMRQGVENPQQLVDDLVSTIGKNFNFFPLIKPEIIEEDSKYFVQIEVEEASLNEKPIYKLDVGPVKGGYKRVGSSDLNLTEIEVQRLYQGRLHSPDAQPLTETSLSDIDVRTLNIYRNIRKLQKEDVHETKLNDVELLRAYKLLSKNGKNLNIAGLLLFGKDSEIRRQVPHFRLDVIRIKGTEWGKDKDPFLSVDLQGNLLYLRSQALDHLYRFFLTPFKLGKDLMRIDDDPFKRALREALSNLLMHQNYFHYSPSQIIIYNNRIEFRNPGYSLKDPETFNVPGSELRNTLIAPVFYDLGWADTKGTGIKTQILPLEKQGYPKAEWINEEINDRFTAIFPYPVEEVTGQVTGQVSPQAKLDDRIARILKYCQNPRSLKEIMKLLEMKHREHFLDEILNPLLDKKLLRRTIPDKPRSPKQKYITYKINKDLKR